MPAFPPAIFLMGPTASGKTDLAVRLVQTLPCDIISVDSALVYRQMDIGTAKPDAATLAIAPHRLLDIRDPAESYSAGDFRRDALAEMAAITAAGRVPLLVGGTALYFQRLLAGEADLPAADPEIRAALEAELAEQGCVALHARLQQLDPESAAKISCHDPQRTVRALELWQLTGKTRSQLWQEQQSEPFPWQVLQLGLAPADRAFLHQRIGQRWDMMMEQGLIQEVEALRRRDDLHLGLPSMRAVGYRQVWQYLDGDFSLAELHEKAKAATRQLAKRQLTWMRSWSGLVWQESQQPQLLDQVQKQVAEFIGKAGQTAL
ncbi:tRNA (adenosine(37)-N6)-dimethylallyltransferase MiaA [Marinospirillum sp. MEB164]|uniref:tRNA dimethylallyltransferase n=1 Tax=Marinospirillum alkalitolerans TaxID=3123374 RepID=A0ABW8PWF0_9GAMM